MSVSKLLILGFGILSCLFVASSVQGAESKLIPQISIKETYTDNIDFSRIEEKDDWIFTITPLIKLDYQTERARTIANAQFDVIEYSKEENLDTVYQKYNLTHNFRATELFGLILNGSLIKDSTLESEMDETGLFLKQTDRNFYNIRPGISLYLTEMASLNINLGYSKAEYEALWYSDYDRYDADLKFVHTLAKEGATVSAHGSYTLSDYETYNVNIYRLYLSLSYPFPEKWKLTAWAGAWHTESDFDRNLGWLTYLALTRAFTQGSGSVTINRDITPSGYGETIERYRTTLSLDYRLSEFITGRFSGSWSRSKSVSQYKNTDEQLYNLRPSLSWQIMEHGKAELSYQYSVIEYMKTDTNAERNTIFLSFTIYWEKLF